MHTNQIELIKDRHNGPPTDAAHLSLVGTSLTDVAVAPEVAELSQEIEALRRRLANLPAIEQAKGVLIGFYAVDADAAFALLVRWSQHTNIKLHRLASDLITAANDTSGHPHAQLRIFIDQLPNSTARLSPIPDFGTTSR
ncbi:ANTAR domain-containing protein [Friedmanniella luteola]|uniref:ANTAR domain-containing protein n=1 Tax=Friedmanniella luteola TaxID=546871 RepID=A0A1H1WN06_9ACTN|nr:ANTAR domain-containing protein [Friedmanniella luteola]SDS98553.1 ANTAR domain-containing protein [Friedmanniella luteola]